MSLNLKTITYLSGVTVITVILLIFFQNYQVISREKMSEYTEKLEEINELKNHISEYRKENYLLKQSNKRIEEEIIKNDELIKSFSNTVHIETELRLRGFNGTIQDIKSDLIKRKDLIPYKGVLCSRPSYLTLLCINPAISFGGVKGNKKPTAYMTIQV
jgi:hypothetical protein